MSTPTTLTQALPPFHQLDHRQRYLPSPQDRYLPPPRPNSNASIHQNGLPARPSSNLSNSQFAAPPPRPLSNMSNRGHTHSHAHGSGQARAGAEQYTNGLTHQSSNESLRRTNSNAHQSNGLPPPRTTHHATTASRPSADSHNQEQGGNKLKRSRHSPVDWVEFFGGKPPEEIITIHDDDSPAPPAEIRKLPPPTNDHSSVHHVDKKRRTNAAGSGGDATYSANNTPYSYSNGTSTESLQTTTAPTSLGSQISSSSRLDGAQTGQKRKRNMRPAEERKKSGTERSSHRGYLAEYGEYIPPPKQKKQKDVHVPAIHDVRLLLDVSG